MTDIKETNATIDAKTAFLIQSMVSYKLNEATDYHDFIGSVSDNLGVSFNEAIYLVECLQSKLSRLTYDYDLTIEQRNLTNSNIRTLRAIYLNVYDLPAHYQTYDAKKAYLKAVTSNR